MRKTSCLILTFGCGFLWTAAAYAQFGRGVDWTTAGSDPHRSSWVRTDPKISVERMQKPGFAVAWKIKLNGEPGVAATLDRYIGYRGFRSYAFTNSASGELTTIDSDLGRVESLEQVVLGLRDQVDVGQPRDEIVAGRVPLSPRAIGIAAPIQIDVGQIGAIVPAAFVDEGLQPRAISAGL